jgi:hypothetical protein
MKQKKTGNAQSEWKEEIKIYKRENENEKRNQIWALVVGVSGAAKFYSLTTIACGADADRNMKT